MGKEQELRACPLCQRSVEAVQMDHDHKANGPWYIECLCGIEMHDSQLPRLITRWNRRSSSDEQAEVVAGGLKASIFPGGRDVLFFASYCGDDNLQCSPAHPCPDCMAMSNVHRIPSETPVVYQRQFGASPSGVKAGVTEVAAAIRAALCDRLVDSANQDSWGVDLLLIGCQKAHGTGYANPSEAANNLAMDAARSALRAIGVGDEGMGEALSAAVGMCEQYAEFIRRVPAADIEQHPYLPELEQVIEIGRLALRKEAPDAHR